MGKKPVQGQIEAVELILYPSTKRKFDLSNHTESLMDLLVDARIIEDDNYGVIPELRIKFGGQDKDNPRAEITIYDSQGIPKGMESQAPRQGARERQKELPQREGAARRATQVG